MMKRIVLAGVGLMALGGAASAQSLPNPIQGTPGSVYPHATASEIRIINGVPCRTVLVYGTNSRVPVDCGGQVVPGMGSPLATGSIGPYGQAPVPPAARRGVRVYRSPY